MWQERNVFVTGGTGLLGSWLVERLLELGAGTVVCLVRDLVPRSRLTGSDLERRVVTVRGDLEDLPLLTRAINEYEIDTVFHLAAQNDCRNSRPLATFNV